MPSADFCTAVRDPRGSLSPPGQRYRSPEVSLTAFTAHLPNLQPWPMVTGTLRNRARSSDQDCLIFGFCPSGRGFASALLSDGSSRPPPLRLASPLSHQTWAEDFHLQAVKHARHTRTRGRADAPTGPCQTAPTRFRTSAHRHHVFSDQETGPERSGERRPDFYASTWSATRKPTGPRSRRCRPPRGMPPAPCLPST